MGIKNLEVKLESTDYYAGATIEGVLCFDTTANESFRQIVVKLRGKAKVEWSEYVYVSLLLSK